MHTSYDLTALLEQSFIQQGFTPEQIHAAKSASNFRRAVGQPEVVQRTYLTLMLNDWLLRSKTTVPSDVRLSLTMAPDVRSWMDDIRLVVIPYLKANPIELPIQPQAFAVA